jgi:nucleoside-diphosphate-sugar epimerase
MRVLITGASGFIGGHLARELLEEGHQVYATQHINPVPEGTIPQDCDLRSPMDVWNAIIDSQPEVVFHLASQPIVTVGEDAERYTYECNVQGTFNLVDELKNYKPKLFIGASTDKVYGRGPTPYTESNCLCGNQQMYETTKTMQDHLMQCYGKYYPTIITRCSNVYGPDDNHPTRIVPHTIHQYIHGEYPTIRSNGQQYRDYMYIDDCVAAYMECMEFGLGGTLVNNLHIFNFGSGTPVRTLDLVSLIREHFPNSQDPEIEYGAKDEIPKQYQSYDKANQLLGWTPVWNLRDGIASTVNYWKGVYDAE